MATPAIRPVSEVRPDGNPEEDFYISLSKLSGSPVKDVLVHLSREFGDVSVVLSQILLEDGRKLMCGGEHDFPYAEDYDKVLNNDELEAMYREENGEDDEDEPD